MAGAAPVVLLCGSSGGGFPLAWELAVCVALPAALLIAWREHVKIGRYAATAVASALLLAVWSLLSLFWSSDVPATAGETQRWVATASLLAFACIAARAWGAREFAGGTALGATIVCVWALGVKLLPDIFGHWQAAGVHRLAEPVGYWNALGELAAVGLVIATGLAAGAGARGRAAAAAAAAPLGGALYLTFSRGSVLCAAVGLLVALLLNDRRLKTAMAGALVPFLAIVGAASLSLFPEVVTAFPDRARLIEQGRLAALLLTLVAILGALAGARWESAVRRMHRAVNRAPSATAVAVVAVLAVTVLAVAAAGGGPGRIARSLGDSSAHFRHGELSRRLLSLSPNGRGNLWGVAWDDATAHPLLGSGDGTFAQLWLRDRSESLTATAAHSLYLETAAELGIVGLGLLLTLLAGVITAGVRSRGDGVAAACTGAVAGALVQMTVDWTWDVTGVTAAVLGSMAVLCVVADSHRGRWIERPRVPAALLAGLATAASLVLLAGSLELHRARTALAAGDNRAARSEAALASRLAPWSSSGPAIQSVAGARLGDRAAARRAAAEGMRRDPGNWWFQLQLACLSTGRARASHLRQAHVRDPLGPEIARFPGWCGSGSP